jgi:sulfur carrier protein ThiS
MAIVRFTKALKRFFPALDEYHTNAKDLTGVLNDINYLHPGIKQYILDEQGYLRKHVNIFINGEMIHDRIALTDHFSEKDEIYIIQALSGG